MESRILRRPLDGEGNNQRRLILKCVVGSATRRSHRHGVRSISVTVFSPNRPPPRPHTSVVHAVWSPGRDANGDAGEVEKRCSFSDDCAKLHGTKYGVC